MSFALPAWAVNAANLFATYAPASWVGAGFAGMMLAAFGYWIFAVARGRWIRAKYDHAMIARGTYVDPLGRTFERKRIYLNEFVLPSHPLIEGKTFTDCDIIGPANVMLVEGNRVDEPKLPFCDAVAVAADKTVNNVFFVRNCSFRGCSFQRVTFFFTPQEVPLARNVDWIRWVSEMPLGQDPELPLELVAANPPAATS